MPRVSHHFVADGPVDAVFDVVTTARFWPEWHPATRGVEGDTGHPARLGDQITEHVTIAGIQGSGTWTVVEHDRPHHLALETDLAFGHLRISYQLTTVDGGRTRFQRDLDFPDLGPQVGAVMEAQSAEGIASLARLVQRQVPAPRAATTEELIAVMEDMQARLDAGVAGIAGAVVEEGSVVADPRDLHRRAGSMAADVIARVRPDQLGNATPCTEWDVRALINHIVGGNLRFAAMVAGEHGPGPDEDVLGGEPLAGFLDSFGGLCAAFDRAGFLEQVFPTPLGEGPGELLVAMRITELTIHAWDASSATGQPRDLDPGLVAFADGVLRSRPIPRGVNGPFAPEQPAPAGATDADRLAAFAGRPVPAREDEPGHVIR